MDQTAPPHRPTSAELQKLKTFLVNTLTNEFSSASSTERLSSSEVKRKLADIYDRLNLQLPEAVSQKVQQEAFDEILGYGPIQSLLEDPLINEIMINGPRTIFIERGGELIETEIAFQDEAHLMRVINRIIQPLGRRVDEEHPSVDARLPDGSRVNAVVPPVAVDGPYLTIRKFLRNKMTLEDLLAMGSLTQHMAEFLQACVAARLNILITGGTSSGKTTMLNILSGMIPGQERIITIEDAVELQLKQRHIVRMETRSAGVDGTGEVTTRDLVRNALRMRPDRIIVGEVRGGETLDMLQAMNTGHSGSLTTLHANTPRDAISRLETTALMSGIELPILALRKQIASAFNLIVHQSRLQDGSRKTTQVTEIAGMESDVVTLTDIYRFDPSGVSSDGKILGELRATGIRPLFTPRLEVVGYKLRSEIFGPIKTK